ncbi:hypothetical protein [Sphingobacterium corticibacter]|uniref:Uncharacterized protein n=1 Tax=Sphingobacterium corticibacter TaxID=2171749 RepID=A0A2T8HNY0_9SPHI|nr:hypothetical protein [Sphingobacterium corticibacter]PVH27012.1 hypothetical protein DC487_05295 [Sphingobacterium corticibacter]
MSSILNSTPATSLGLYFRRGSLYSELLKLPKPKERFFNEWPDQHGREYDTTSPTVYEPLQYSIACYLTADSIGDLQQKRSDVLELISKPEGFTLFSETLGRGFALRYIESGSFNTINPIWSKGKLYCEFTLTLENNFAPTEQLFRLEDINSIVLTEKGEEIYVMDYTIQF